MICDVRKKVLLENSCFLPLIMGILPDQLSGIYTWIWSRSRAIVSHVGSLGILESAYLGGRQAARCAAAHSVIIPLVTNRFSGRISGENGNPSLKKISLFCTLENLDNNYKCTRKKEISPFAIIGSESMATSDGKHDKNFAKALEDSFKAMVKIHSSLIGVHTTNASLASLTACNGSLNILQFVFLLSICHCLGLSLG